MQIAADENAQKARPQPQQENGFYATKIFMQIQRGEAQREKGKAGQGRERIPQKKPSCCRIAENRERNRGGKERRGTWRQSTTRPSWAMSF